jgi:hypothetical protein
MTKISESKIARTLSERADELDKQAKALLFLSSVSVLVSGMTTFINPQKTWVNYTVSALSSLAGICTSIVGINKLTQANIMKETANEISVTNTETTNDIADINWIDKIKYNRNFTNKSDPRGLLRGIQPSRD